MVSSNFGILSLNFSAIRQNHLISFSILYILGSLPPVKISTPNSIYELRKLRGSWGVWELGLFNLPAPVGTNQNQLIITLNQAIMEKSQYI